ncbi:MAG TPA: M15 family metallopeptidase [Armatimonadota bacterium]|nr:M15 family metallopeptidase [Armatimonadota bacterium]
MGNFYTDVIRVSPHYRTPYRISDPQLLEPATRRKVEAILKDAAAHGVMLGIYETYRSEERQERLFQQGASQLRHVGVHHYGLACDIVYLVDGEPSWKGDFGLLGHLARAHGLVWGGDWGHPGRPTGFPDQDHVQRCAVWQQADLFRGGWYPA